MYKTKHAGVVATVITIIVLTLLVFLTNVNIKHLSYLSKMSKFSYLTWNRKWQTNAIIIFLINLYIKNIPFNYKILLSQICFMWFIAIL